MNKIEHEFKIYLRLILPNYFNLLGKIIINKIKIRQGKSVWGKLSHFMFTGNSQISSKINLNKKFRGFDLKILEKMSCPECLICCDRCDPLIDTSFNTQNAITLCQTLGLPQQQQIKNSQRSDSEDTFTKLLESSTFCQRCVGMVQDLGIVLMELEKLNNALEQGRLQIESELKNSLKNNNEKLKGEESGDVNLQNQNLRMKIITQLTTRTDSLTNLIPLRTTKRKLILNDEVSLKKLCLEEGQIIPALENSANDIIYESEDSEDHLLPPDVDDYSHSPPPSSHSFKNKSDVHDEELSVNIPSRTEVGQESKRPSREIGLPVVLIRRLEMQTKTNSEPRRISSRMRKRSIKLQLQTDNPDDHGESQDDNQACQPIRRPGPGRRNRLKYIPAPIDWMHCEHAGCKYKCKPNEEFHMKVHIRRVHEGFKDKFVCEEEGCGRSFYDIRQLRIHNYKCHNGVCPFICPDCQEEFSSHHAFQLHIAVTHKPELVKFRCEVCDRGFIDPWRHKLHTMSHTKQRPVMCEHCSMTFNTPELLKYHQARHHPTESKLTPSICKECGKIFASPVNLRGHVNRMHLNQFKHQCEICGYGSLTPSALKFHMTQRHSDARNYKCNLCTSSFKTNHQLTIHMRTHSGERPYVCRFCSKRFTGSGKLSRHVLIHTRSQCHECEYCGKTFPLRNYLYVHLKSHKRKGETVKLKENGSESEQGTSVTSSQPAFY